MNRHPTIHQTRRFWLNVQECLEITLPSPDRRRLSRLRTAARLGKPLPIQLVHYLEVLGSELKYVNDVHPINGLYGGSPAATIAMVNHSTEQSLHSSGCISEMAARFGGALPTMTQLNTFERSWVIYNLLQADMPVPPDLASAAADYFMSCLGSRGASFTPGQLPDADNSAMVLYVLSALGYTFDPSCLLTYESETYFRCYDGERHPSVSTNAHILEAFGKYVECRRSVPQYQNAIAKTSAYLLGIQQQDGSWIDNWHASPYYGTACSVLALGRFGVGDTREALERAIAWVLRNQRDDGSWGVWCGTLEETAYALQILLVAGGAKDPVVIKQVARRGEYFLRKHLNASPSDAVHTPLWHGKELYEPRRIVRAAVLSALYLCATRLNTQLESKQSLTTCVA
ncbi:hypothetical protein [Coleofasciculus sp.]|uniref:hypothetical protein n=1 Tax=Coleofasciculus sp. TaxID=3100458 RepID=UPI003A4847E4